MISLYHNILEYKNDEWERYFEKLCIIDVFKELLEEYPDTDTFRCVVRYILWGYSVESDKVILNQDWQKNKQNIFEAAMVKPMREMYEALVLLKNPIVVETIHRWLNFQDNETFSQIQILKDLRVEMQLTCVSSILKSSGEQDFDQKMKNAKYAVELKAMIRDLESELIQNSISLKDAVKEIRTTKSKNTIGVEMFAK